LSQSLLAMVYVWNKLCAAKRHALHVCRHGYIMALAAWTETKDMYKWFLDILLQNS